MRHTRIIKGFMKKIKITYQQILCNFYLTIIVISVVVIAIVTLFLYKNFYQTIIQSEEILVLRKEVAIEDINMSKFEKIMNQLQEKIKERDLNIFIRF